MAVAVLARRSSTIAARPAPEFITLAAHTSVDAARRIVRPLRLRHEVRLPRQRQILLEANKAVPASRPASHVPDRRPVLVKLMRPPEDGLTMAGGHAVEVRPRNAVTVGPPFRPVRLLVPVGVPQRVGPLLHT